MSGHSKWSTIKRKKGANDAQRAKIFTKIARELIVAVKAGGPDPANNSSLKDVIAKARANNMPNDNINRTIKKASGAEGSADYEAITYEGYGPGGVAVIVETLTDNRNRTAADVRAAFSKYGGNMGTTGCVSFMFDNKGIIVIEDEDGELDEDEVTMDALEAGAEDVSIGDGIIEIETAPLEVGAVREALEGKYTISSAEAQQIPQTTTTLTDEKQITNMRKLLDTLEDNDDVQNVYHSWDEPETED
ncbi:MAG TPA: YebC/PmpR family DNA-binding transcriptional regulator [Candidatus Ornithomonoglobus merdipullorum]|uniref:Probable transcriptional regulatory protein IAA61_06550 n=1 Tax=Candidatus Ornithomonoglobus merdipullorum TaxID=2840895 RepID=A0A9D1SER5_9FIRM|nr:YebC/PmpR family DNA-binding transcriptional regulator [Candidatus Ornithomonoglobus merdipullorum]